MIGRRPTRETINADVIRVGNLPEGERALLGREGYVVGGDGVPAASVVALTVLGLAWQCAR